ncbi:MAG: glycosyl hydrolase, partial [Phenylobacterium zucineum]
MMMRRLLPVFAAVAALSGPVAQAAPAKIRVLYLDQSVGFVHKPVSRPANSNGPTPSEIALAEIAARTGAFTVESTQDARV